MPEYPIRSSRRIPPNVAQTIALLAIVWATVLLPAPSSAQGTEPNHAGLVVRHGDGRVTYVYVAFVEDELNGIELLRRSGLEAVTIPFGGLGEGVCSIEGGGCGVDGCRRLCQTGGRESPYWRYFGQDSAGAWVAFELGASSARARNGDVQLWSWSPDSPNLDPVTHDMVRSRSGYVGDPDGDGPWTATTFPPGMAPGGTDNDGQPWVVYLLAGGILAGIASAAVLATKRSRRGASLEDPA